MIRLIALNESLKIMEKQRWNHLLSVQLQMVHIKRIELGCWMPRSLPLQSSIRKLCLLCIQALVGTPVRQVKSEAFCKTNLSILNKLAVYQMFNSGLKHLFCT